MNNRIYELAEQAGFENGHQDRNGNSLSYELEKFAELIVRECMDLVKDCYAAPESGQSPYTTACASTMIEEHFGVE